LKGIAFAATGCVVLLIALSLGTVPGSSRVHSCACVAFRLDDIQDYFLNRVQVEVMEVFDRRNASLTVGIIGNYFGSDPLITSYVKSRVGDPSFEIANHGWNHEDFSELDKKEQATLIQLTNEKIYDQAGVQPKVFIAPYNIINGDTFAAARESGMRYISANVTYDPPPYDIGTNQSLYRLPETALMGDLNSNDTAWLTFGSVKVIAEIEHSIERHGFAVVTMHPQDFAMREMLDYQNLIDHDHIKELEMLLDLIGERGIRTVALDEINQHVQESEALLAQPRKETHLAGG
jgi:peptidoglycan/xylan/chitin deacetylase (PgdA/CDA1 family)